MVPPATPSRRALLIGIAAGLAGCSGTESSTNEYPPDGSLVTDYTVEIARSSTDAPPITQAPTDDDGDADDASTPDPVSNRVLESESDAAELVFDDDAMNAAAARRLVAETNYASESVFVYQRPVGECYRLKVNYVTRADDGDPNVQLCRVIRDAGIDCERDAYDHEAVAVRLPFPADEYNGFSVGGGGSCDPAPQQSRNGSDSA